MQDEIEPMPGEIEHRNEYPSQEAAWARWGAGEQGPE